jgi:hypothetical protein
MTVRAVLAAVALAVAALAGVLTRGTPPPLPASAPAGEFSAERAMRELSVIASRPHPTGTVAADAVRGHVVARLEELGFTVEVQDTTSLSDQYARRFGLPVVAAHVRNVIARKKGREAGPGLLLMAHYDSRELAPGASDDGYGTAAILETARALSASAPLRHDLLVLVTEGEEQGLLGARAFLAESPVAKDVGLVLNFEARGDAGAVSMFQTSEGAGGLVDVLGAAVPHVDASSLSQEVYRRMPNDTDLTPWLRAGYPGMNFANVDGFARYHQPTDSLANADRGTLQHHGSYALALTRAFANREVVAPPRGDDQVYFDAGPVFVHYAAREATTLAAFALGLFMIAAGVGLRRGRFRATGILAGTARAVLGVVAAGLLAEGVWWVVAKSTGGALAMQGARAELKTTFDAGMLALGAAVAWAVTTLRSRRADDVALGALVPWAALALASACWLRGGSYLFAWPAIAAYAAWCVRVGAPRLAHRHPVAVAVHLVAAIAAIYLFVPLALQLGVAFGCGAAPALAALGALAMSAAVPSMQTVGFRHPWLPPVVVAGGAVVAMSIAAISAPFDSAYPRPDSLLYALDEDQDRATWVSADAAPDGWTAGALREAQRTPATHLFPRSTTEMLEAPAPATKLETPRIGVLEDARSGDTRTLRLRVTLPSGTEIVGLEVAPDAHVKSASVQARTFGPEDDGWLDLAFFGPPGDGLELDLEAASSGPVTLHIVAQTRGLPTELAAPLGRRPSDGMPSVMQANPLGASDMTLVASSFEL